MNPYTYGKPGETVSPQAPVGKPSLLTQLIGAELHPTIAILIVAFFALSGIALATLAFQETTSAYESSLTDTKVAYAKSSSSVLGEYLTAASRPQYETVKIFKSAYLELTATPFEYSEHVNKWNYKISWNRAGTRTGSIYINGNLLKDQASGVGEVYTGFNLDPETRYRITFYTSTNGKGSRIVNRYFTTIAGTKAEEDLEDSQDMNAYDPLPPVKPLCTQDAKMCPDGSWVSRVAPSCQFAACPTSSSDPRTDTTYTNYAYGYTTVHANTVPKGSWREGWVESIQGIPNFGIRISGWAYDENKAIALTRTSIKNVETGQTYEAGSYFYQAYRQDVSEYLKSKTGSLPAGIKGSFIAEFNNLPNGKYIFYSARYNEHYHFNVHGTGQQVLYINRTDLPAYGYNLPNNGAKTGTIAEGWIEQLSTTPNGQLSVRGWVYDTDKPVQANINFYNSTTGQNKTVHIAINILRSDVGNFISNKYRIGGITVPTGFFYQSTDFSPGSYQIVGATFTRLDGTNNANFFIHGNAAGWVNVNNTQAPQASVPDLVVTKVGVQGFAGEPYTFKTGQTFIAVFVVSNKGTAAVNLPGYRFNFKGGSPDFSSADISENTCSSLLAQGQALSSGGSCNLAIKIRYDYANPSVGNTSSVLPSLMLDLYQAAGETDYSNNSGMLSFRIASNNVSSPEESVRVGALVNVAGSIYFVGNLGLYGFPDLATFNSWDFSLAQTVLANSKEAALKQMGIVTKKNSYETRSLIQVLEGSGSSGSGSYQK